MAGASLPKPPGQRRRRNAVQPQWRSLPESHAGKPPPLPTKRPTWLKATREWWRTIWVSPMATAWLPSDVPTLVRLARIVESDNRGEASASLLAEARQLEDRYGLSPKARRQLQWEVSQGRAGDEPELDEPTAPPPRSTARRRLRAV